MEKIIDTLETYHEHIKETFWTLQNCEKEEVHDTVTKRTPKNQQKYFLTVLEYIKNLENKKQPGRQPWWAQARRAQVGCAHPVAPLWWLLAPVFLKYSIKNPRGVSSHLELCRIGGLT